MSKEKFASAKFSDFSDISELYRSHSGAIHKGKFKYDNKFYVLKEKKLSELGRAKDVMNEVKLLLQLRHVNVVQCEGWFRDMDRGTLFIVLEYCGGGDLSQIIEQRKRMRRRFSESEIWFIFKQICQGVCHLHQNGIIHRDIKALNVFYDPSHERYKIGDLGVSRQLSEQTMMVETFYGTPLYLSPELVENRAYNEKTDIWSLGVLLYELCALQPPFRAGTLMELAKLVVAGVYEPVSDRYSPVVHRCLSWMLTKDYRKRPSIVELLDYLDRLPPWRDPIVVDEPGNDDETNSAGSDGDDATQSEDSIDGGRPRSAASARRQSHAAGVGRPTPPRPSALPSSMAASFSNPPQLRDVPTAKAVEAEVVRDSLDAPAAVALAPAARIPAGTDRRKGPAASPDQRVRHVSPKTSSAKADVRNGGEDTDEGDSTEEDAVDDVLVLVHKAKCVARHRRESMRLRKLLQTRDFLLSSAAAENVCERIGRELELLRKDLQWLESAVASGSLPLRVANRLKVAATQKTQHEPADQEKPPPAPVVSEDLPVYLQPGPRSILKQKLDGQGRASAARLDAAGARRVVPLDIPAKPVAAVKEDFLLPPASQHGQQQRQKPERMHSAEGMPRKTRTEKKNVFVVNVHVDGTALPSAVVAGGDTKVLETDAGGGRNGVEFDSKQYYSNLRRPLLGTESTSRVNAAPPPSKRDVLAERVRLAALEDPSEGLCLPSMSAKSRPRTAPAQREIVGDRQRLYSHGRHISDICAVFEKDDRFHRVASHVSDVFADGAANESRLGSGAAHPETGLGLGLVNAAPPSQVVVPDPPTKLQTNGKEVAQSIKRKQHRTYNILTGT